MSIFSKWFSSKAQQDEVVPSETTEETVSSEAQEAVGNYCEEGQKQLAAGNYVLAMEYFQAAIGTNKHDVRACIGLSEAYLAQGKVNEAEKAIYQLLAIDPGSKSAQEQLDKIKGRKTELEATTAAQPKRKYTEEELREKIRESIKITIGDPSQTSAPFDPQYELKDYRFPASNLYLAGHDSRDGNIHLDELLSSEEYTNTNYVLPCVVGKTATNDVCCFDLTKTPNVLIAGASGTGKSTLCHTMIISLLHKIHPAELKLVLVDLKGLEFNYYNRIERHYLAKLQNCDEGVLTDADKTVNTLNSLCHELDERIKLLKAAGCRNVSEYNETFKQRRLSPTEGHRFLPYLVIVIDDYSILVSAKGKESSTPLIRLLESGKSVGIHAIIGTSRVSTDVFPSQMKACVPTRIAFRVNSASESRSLLDAVGANTLREYGEMLVLVPGSTPTMVHGPVVSSMDIDSITSFVSSQRGFTEPYLLKDLTEPKESTYFTDTNERDPLFEEAARIVVQTQQGSTSMIQRKLKLGYNRSGLIIDQLEAAGIVGPFNGSSSRRVLVGSEFALEQILKDLENK